MKYFVNEFVKDRCACVLLFLKRARVAHVTNSIQTICAKWCLLHVDRCSYHPHNFCKRTRRAYVLCDTKSTKYVAPTYLMKTTVWSVSYPKNKGEKLSNSFLHKASIWLDKTFCILVLSCLLLRKRQLRTYLRLAGLLDNRVAAPSPISLSDNGAVLYKWLQLTLDGLFTAVSYDFCNVLYWCLTLVF